MKIEIAIEGPWEGIRALHGKLPDRSEKPQQGTGIDAQRARLILIEEEATAERNVVLNALSERIVISCGSWESVQGRADLLLANLVPAVLLRTGSEIPGHLNEGGCAVVSGFGQNQSKDIEDFFARLDLRTTERLEQKLRHIGL